MDNIREQLISELKKIQERQYVAEDAEYRWKYVCQMLDYIGDTDPYLRDELIYFTLNEWIDEKDYFNDEQLKSILSVLLDENHLFKGIGSDGDDSVFTRTFSALGVVLVLQQHRKKAFLNTDEFIDLKNKAIRYYTSERDHRGYTSDKGWAHATAHGADMMDELVQCRETDGEVIGEILNAFKSVMYNGRYVFHNEEDERICRVVFRIIKNGLISKQAVAAWLEELCECTEWERDRAQYVARVNAKNFVRCLYFKLIHSDSASDLLSSIFKAEERLNRFLLIDKELIENKD